MVTVQTHWLCRCLSRVVAWVQEANTRDFTTEVRLRHRFAVRATFEWLQAVECVDGAGDSRSVVVRAADVRYVQRQWRSVLDRISAAPVLYQLGPLHRRDWPVQLRASNDASQGRSDPRHRLDGVLLSLAHPNTPRPVHDCVTTRQTRRRQQRVLVQGLFLSCYAARPLTGRSTRYDPPSVRLSVSCLFLTQEQKSLETPNWLEDCQ